MFEAAIKRRCKTVQHKYSRERLFCPNDGSGVVPGKWPEWRLSGIPESSALLREPTIRPTNSRPSQRRWLARNNLAGWRGSAEATSGASRRKAPAEARSFRKRLRARPPKNHKPKAKYGCRREVPGVFWRRESRLKTP